ncbi:hypothetical protein GGS20DRAFT_582893 [Poronia punctata]|nr:hypothetical protein GGS20DRAFT_582893 [Poronia punctata]
MNPPQRQQHSPSHRSSPHQRQQSPRGVNLEDSPSIGPQSHRRDSSRFDTEEDYYNFLQSNRAPPTVGMAAAAGSPGGPGGLGVSIDDKTPPPIPSSQAPILMQPQRNGPPNSRPPVANNYQGHSRAPSYTSNRSEDVMSDRGARGSRQNVRRGGPPKPMPSGPRPRASSPTPPVSGGSSPTHPHSQHGTFPGMSAMDDGEPAGVGGSIQRLKSPSVLECVLKPLEAKVREYEVLMRREQDEIKRLDDELRALQARRSETEARFDEAKAKHDEYQRQHNDVQRAMSGGLPPTMMSPALQGGPQRPATGQGPGPGSAGGQQRPMSEHQRRYGDNPYDDDFDGEEGSYVEPSYNASRRVQSQQSFGHGSRKSGFRFSNLFRGR